MDEKSIIDKIQEERNLSIASKNDLINRIDELVIEFANNNMDKGIICFIADKSSKIENAYVIYKYENEEEILIVSKEDLPQEAYINCILRYENEEYIYDDELSKELFDDIMKVIKEVLDNHENSMNKHRKEGHIYRLSDEINGKVFLCDITEDDNDSFEETDFPEELIEDALYGEVFVYVDGTYKLYE